MSFDAEETAREFDSWYGEVHDEGDDRLPGIAFVVWADERGLTVDQQRQVREESDLLEVADAE